MQSPLISIIVPVYNRPHEFVATLKSIEKQTYDNLEIIVIDDGSTEKLEVVSSKLKINYIRQENKGAPVARNKGFFISKGDYVIFWDADAVGKQKMIQKMYNALQQYPNTSYAYCNFYFGKKKMPSQAFSSSALQYRNYIHTTSLIRRKAFQGFDESIKKFQDWDLWLTMLEQNKQGIWIDEYLLYVSLGGTMSNWLPSFAYHMPWKLLPGIRQKVKRYEIAYQKIVDKHHLNKNK